jgi:heme-degrading monooxygenase HmoA
MAYVLVWEYRVRATAAADFERLYGPAGGWAAFFGADPHYVATELLRDDAGLPRYVTIDRWRSRDAYERFRQANLDRYRALDEEGERLTDSERFLGAFHVVDGSDA